MLIHKSTIVHNCKHVAGVSDQAATPLGWSEIRSHPKSVSTSLRCMSQDRLLQRIDSRSLLASARTLNASDRQPDRVIRASFRHTARR